MTGPASKIWEAPAPSSGFLEGVSLKTLPRRSCTLSFVYEGPAGDMQTCKLRFDDVAAFKCTYLPALTVDMIESAYDRLVDMGRTAWLADAKSGDLAAWNEQMRHLRICFDDGPCYEFLCGAFESVILECPATRHILSGVTMATIEVDLLTEQGNNAVLKLPDRKFPGLLIQGDSLSILAGAASDALAALERQDAEEAQGHLEEVARLLRDAKDRYEAALRGRGIALPY